MKSLTLLCLLLTSRMVLGQQNGQLTGTVTDEKNAAISHATVEIKALKKNTFTNEAGSFALAGLPQGEYLLEVRHSGHKPVNQQVVIVSGQNKIITLICPESAVQLEQIVVTAEKRENLLQRVPMAISALSARQIEDRKIREMGDLVLSVPNLMTMNIGSPTLNIMSLRGVLTFSTDPVIGIYVDGIPMFDGYSASMHLQNLQRVEVLRGPQSTLYGRNGLGGVINILTKTPGNNTAGFVEAGIGNYGAQRYNFALSGALVKNKLFAGVSGLYDTRNGFFTNEFTGRDFDKPQTYNGNVYLKYLATDKLSFTLNAKGEYNHVKGTFPYATGGEQVLARPFTINQNGTNIEKRKLFSTSLQALYQLKSFQLSSVTGYTYLTDAYQDYDVDYTPYDVMKFEMPARPQGTFTQEFKIITDESRKLKLIGGVFGFADRKEASTVYLYGPDAASFDPNAPYSSTIFSDKKTYGIAAYANATYSFAEKWDASVGIRYDYEKRNLLHSTDFVKAPNPPVLVVPETKIYGSNSAFSPKVGLSYKPAEFALLYASYARGYRAGGFNPYTNETAYLNYRPEFTNNFEIGFKSEWFHNRLRVNAAVFYTHWKDQQQNLSLPQNRVDNVGEMVSTGAELELTGVVIKGLELSYNLGFVHTDYKRLLLPDETGTANKDFAGNKQIFTPSYTSALSATYRMTLSDKASAYFIPEWKYFGKQYMTYYNDLVQDPFSLLTASAGVKLKCIELSIWGKNLGDARYISFAYATQTAAATPMLVGNPRTFGASVKVRF